METPDHALTKSFAGSRAAREYRARQRELVEQGRFREAVQMDIDDVRRLFGNKYDEAIRQMNVYIDYLERLGAL